MTVTPRDEDLRTLRKALTGGAPLAGRTRALLRGALVAPDLEGRSVAKAKGRQQTTVRYPAELLERAEALTGRLQRDPTIGGLGNVSRSAVLILALRLGLDVLEARHPTQPTRGKR